MINKTVPNYHTCVAQNGTLIGRDAYWLYEENVSGALFPRTYNPSTDQQTFVEDFRLTATADLLKFVRGTTVAEEIVVTNN